MLQDVTYADLKFGQNPPEGTRLEDLTYANVQAPSRPEQKGGGKQLPWLLAVGSAGIALVLLAALIALGVHYGKLQKEKGQLAMGLDRAMEDLNQTRESMAQREDVLNATWTRVAKDWCPEDWILYQGKCLFFSTETRNWERSQVACEALSSRLLITRSWQAGQLQGLLASNYYWIGLRKWFTQPWTWVDGSRYHGKELASYDTCAYLNNGETKVYGCSYPLAYICEKTKRGTQ
ncbi:C-type lectin domain family 2 member B-like [Anolis sagrei]|uniref:C-type lectin domain family 2 member B-like n=1 Tax=Anolis sagrei TaxID=38937 RepID=UPI003521E09B